jgi:hypothetical protein
MNLPAEAAARVLDMPARSCSALQGNGQLGFQ